MQTASSSRRDYVALDIIDPVGEVDHSLSDEPLRLEMGNYEQNNRAIEQMGRMSMTRAAWILEVFKREGTETLIAAGMTTFVTIGVWAVSKTILAANTQAIMQLSIENYSKIETMSNIVGWASVLLGTASSATGALIVAQAITSGLNSAAIPLHNLFSEISKPAEGPSYQSKQKLLAFRELERRANELKKDLPPANLWAFESTFEDLRSHVDSLSAMSKGGLTILPPDYPRIKQLTKRIALFFSYPTKLQDQYLIGVKGNIEKAKMQKEKIGKFLSSYENEELKESLKQIIHTISFSTIHRNDVTLAFMFHGPAASGKTWAVNHIGEEILGARVLKMTINEYLEMTGVKPSSLKPTKSGGDDLEAASRTNRSRIKSGNSLNEIILIDEVKFIDDGEGKNDLDYEGELKDALTRKASDYAGFEALNIKSSYQPPVIFCSNSPISDTLDALRSRFSKIVEFPNPTFNAIKLRIDEAIDETTSDNPTDPVHWPEATARTKNELNGLKTFILDEIKKHGIFLDKNKKEYRPDPEILDNTPATHLKVTIREIKMAIRFCGEAVLRKFDKAIQNNIEITPDALSKKLEKITKVNIVDYFNDIAKRYDKKLKKPEPEVKPESSTSKKALSSLRFSVTTNEKNHPVFELLTENEEPQSEESAKKTQ